MYIYYMQIQICTDTRTYIITCIYIYIHFMVVYMYIFPRTHEPDVYSDISVDISLFFDTFSKQDQRKVTISVQELDFSYNGITSTELDRVTGKSTGILTMGRSHAEYYVACDLNSCDIGLFVLCFHLVHIWVYFM